MTGHRTPPQDVVSLCMVGRMTRCVREERYLMPQAARDRVAELQANGHRANYYRSHRDYVVQVWEDAPPYIP